MAENKARVICVGEVMVELSRGNEARYGLAFGGDTFNTAVYLARAGIDTAYATALGDDPYSGALMALAAAENVSTDFIARVPGRMPGLYVIETDDTGERKFFYWRDTSPARAR
jgi:2-dehydro-3-deoxygluconokinase